MAQPVRCAACGSSQPAGAAACTVCGTAMSVAATVDDLAPVGDRSRTVPEAPVSAAVAPEHLPPPKPAQSAQNAAASYLAAGTVIDGKYAIVRLLGQGGMGVVYLARDIHTGMDVVLKSVRSELAHRADVRARTLAEGRVLGQIDHPNVVHLKAVVVDDRSLWLVMQYIDGESLDRTIERHAERKERMPLAEALRLFRQIASGIAAAHAEGIIHRDLKPANVLIRRKDQVAKVTDFGIAKAEHEATPGRIQTRGVIGSIWYMSPEQVTGRRDLDKRVDIYALGIVLFQMLTGRVPFDAESDYEVMRLQAEAPLPRVGKEREDVPPSVDDLLQKLCAKNRDERLQSCEDVLRALAPIEAELAGGGAPAAAPAITTAPVPGRTGAPPSEPPPAHTAGPPSKDVTAPPIASTRAGADGAAEASPPAPETGKRRIGLWIAIGLVLAGAGSVATLVAAGVIPPPAKWTAAPARSGAPSASGTAPAGATATASAPAPPSASAPAAAPAFERLAGMWLGDGDRALEAVKVADSVEFRIKDPAQFAPADYEAGETRFVLRRLPGEEMVFAVEDRLRPKPPLDFPFAAVARATCQEVRSEASGAPLRATLEGGRLSVELMKLEPTSQNFLLEKGKTVSCVGLGKLRASKVVSVLTRK